VSEAGQTPVTGWLRPFRRPRVWIGIWIAAIILVIVLSLVPPPALPVPHWFDKVEHFLSYALLSTGAVMLFARMRTQALAAAGLVMLGIALEIAQAALTATRAGDSADALANTLGVFAGLMMSPTPLAGWLQRIDARLR